MSVHAWVAAGAALLFAVVWWDMVFDSQTLKHPTGTLPPDVLASLSGYYRRCTVEGGPMMYLPVLIMVLVLVAIVTEIMQGWVIPWVGWVSLALAAWAVISVAFIAVPRAQRIGRAQEPPEVLSGLARTALRLHAGAALSWVIVIWLQLGI